MNIYEVDFIPYNPVGCTLLIRAESRAVALEEAKTLLPEDRIEGIKRIPLNNSTQVLAFQSGEY